MDLPSEYLLMATRDRTGKPIGWHHYGFGGAVLAELALAGHVEIRDRRLAAVGDGPRDDLLRFVWHDVSVYPRERKAGWWVERISGRRYRLLRRQWTERLVAQGILRQERVRFLGTHRYPSQGTGAEERLRTRIRRTVAARDPSDPRLVCLIALLTASESLREVAKGPERRRIARQAKRWMKEEPWAKAVGEVVETLMVVIMATAATSAVIGGGS